MRILPKQRRILTVGSLASQSCIFCCILMQCLIFRCTWEGIVPGVVPQCSVVIQALCLPGQLTSLHAVKLRCQFDYMVMIIGHVVIGNYIFHHLLSGYWPPY